MAEFSTAPSSSIQIVESYGPGGFRISGVRHEGALLVTPESTTTIEAASIADLTILNLAPLIAPDANIELLLLGCGRAMQMPAVQLRNDLRANGIALEPMNTGAACRTYNVLVGENRRVAAVLLPI